MAGNTSQNTAGKDHWSSSAYQLAASFVPQLTSTVTRYLDAQPGESILDLGCGDGVLTFRIAQAVSGAGGGQTEGRVVGVDASPSFIDTARAKYQASNSSYILHDATTLETCAELGLASSTQPFDKVFSNAAMHWILRKPSTRDQYFKNVFNLVRGGGGKFVFEMGGHGNVAEVQAAATAVLLHAGIPLAAAREASPWFFPSTEWMTKALTDVGFKVQVCELQYRPTKLTVSASGSGEGGDGTGLEGWVRLMCAQFLDVFPPNEQEKRERVIREMCEVLQPIITHEEDGSQWIGNVRLRAVAVKE